jgi:hypothetical protein
MISQRAPGLITGSRKPHPKAKFSQEEDEELRRAVQENGTESWQSIAMKIQGRTTRQCKERWLNYLSPDVGNGPWTSLEDELLLTKVQELGFAWKLIAACFPTRTDINVKSRWRLIQRHVRREILATHEPLSRLRSRTTISASVRAPASGAIPTDYESSGLETFSWDDDLGLELWFPEL